MLESTMRQIVVKALKPLDAISVENPARPGTPDINYVEGWIELKILDAWPVREDTKVKVACFTPQQRVWLRRRVSRGGNAFFLIRIADDWLMYHGDVAATIIGDADKRQMINEAILWSKNKLDVRALFEILKNA